MIEHDPLIWVLAYSINKEKREKTKSEHQNNIDAYKRRLYATLKNFRSKDILVEAEKEYQDAVKAADNERKISDRANTVKYSIFFISCLFFIIAAILLSLSKNPGYTYSGITLMILSGILLLVCLVIKGHSDNYDYIMIDEAFYKDRYKYAKDIHDEIFRRLEWCNQVFPKNVKWSDLHPAEKEKYLTVYIDKYKSKNLDKFIQYSIDDREDVFCYFFKTTEKEVLPFKGIAEYNCRTKKYKTESEKNCKKLDPSLIEGYVITIERQKKYFNEILKQTPKWFMDNFPNKTWEELTDKEKIVFSNKVFYEYDLWPGVGFMAVYFKTTVERILYFWSLQEISAESLSTYEDFDISVKSNKCKEALEKIKHNKKYEEAFGDDSKFSLMRENEKKLLELYRRTQNE